MALILDRPLDRPRRHRLVSRLAVMGAVAGAGALIAAAGLLWARHGATVFFDVMSAGLGSCL